MAATDRGAEVAASKPHSKRCGAPLKDGRFCGKWATEATGWETCYQHSVSEAEWKAAARRGGLAAAAKKRAVKAGNVRSGLASHIRLEEVLSVCTAAMTATFADAGLPQEIDWDARLLSLVVLLGVFPKQYRSRPDEAAALLLKVLPERVRSTKDADEMQRQIAAGYARAREAWRQERGMVAALRGLYTDESYPRDLIAAWEDAEALNAELSVYMEELEEFYEDKEVSRLTVA
jgi:hypothetical protein